MPHLGKSQYCVYLWNEAEQQFRYDPESPAVGPMPHPETKTITAHQDWQGGSSNNSTYRWNGTKIELIEENGTVYGSDDPNCGSTDFCRKLINGKMVITAEKPSSCSGKQDVPLVCPVNPDSSTVIEPQEYVVVQGSFSPARVAVRKRRHGVLFSPVMPPPDLTPPPIYTGSAVNCNDISGTWQDSQSGGTWSL